MRYVVTARRRTHRKPSATGPDRPLRAGVVSVRGPLGPSPGLVGHTLPFWRRPTTDLLLDAVEGAARPDETLRDNGAVEIGLAMQAWEGTDMRNRAAIREYVTGSLWVLPGASAVTALVLGFILSRIDVGPASPLAFQGTADDARALLGSVTGTVVTVIALVLGLTVVALQLASTQFSPRLLRSFLRDRPTQVVLSTFVATFAYSAAGLYTVGLSAGEHTEDFPRLAVSGAIALLFASLAMVVYFADHLAHSIQIDTIGERVEQDTLTVVKGLRGPVEDVDATAPEWAVPLRAPTSGYLQSADPASLLPLAARHGVRVRLTVWVGDHVVAGTVLAWAWTAAPDDPAPDPGVFQDALARAVRIGFERTPEQDAALGIRQLVDMACKALSPAVNDPYTAVQAIDHLSVIFCALAVRPLGDEAAADPAGRGIVVVPGRRFGDYLATACGLIRRYGCAEPTVSLALLRLLHDCAAVVADDSARWAAIGEQADLIVADATRETAQPADLEPVLAAAADMRRLVARRLPAPQVKSSTEPSATPPETDG